MLHNDNPIVMKFDENFIIRPINEDSTPFTITPHIKLGKWKICIHAVATVGIVGRVVRDIAMYHEDHFTAYHQINKVGQGIVDIDIGDIPDLFIGYESSFKNDDLVPKSIMNVDSEDFFYPDETFDKNINGAKWHNYFVSKIYGSPDSAKIYSDHNFLVSRIGYGGGKIKIRYKTDSNQKVVRLGVIFVEGPVSKLNTESKEVRKFYESRKKQIE